MTEKRGKKYDEKMVNTVGADHTDDASRKQPHKLITVDSDGIGGVSVASNASRGEGGVRWKELYRQEWAGLDWKSRSGLGDRRGLRGQLQGLWSQL